MEKPTVKKSGEAYDQIADNYDEMYSDNVSKMEDEAVENLLKKSFCDSTKVLDIGCGTGWLLDHFPDINPLNYHGVDPSEKMLDHARKKHPSYLFRQDKAEQLPKGIYRWSDLILMIYGVGNHVDLEVVLANIFAEQKDQTIIMFFISGRRPCRAGLEMIDYELDEILQSILTYDSQIRELSVRGLTKSDFSQADTSIDDAYSWIFTIEKCQE